MNKEKNKFTISPSEMEFQFVRSSGPGGQNVNKTNTKAQLKWRPLSSSAFNLDEKSRIILKLKNKITSDGFLIITSDRSRNQAQNKDDCINKLYETLTQALIVPKKRKKTKPTKSSLKKSIQSNQKKSEKKTNRKPIRNY